MAPWIYTFEIHQPPQVCQFNSKKKGGFDCKASYRTKKFKHDGSVTVEKSSAEHDDKLRGSEDERTYDV